MADMLHTRVDWQAVIIASLPHLRLVDIYSISLCSKTARDLLGQLLRSGRRTAARSLLYEAVQPASACQPHPSHLTAAIRWLLSTAAIPDALMFEDSAKYTGVSGVPLDACKQLVAAGVRVNKEQLLSAVQRLVSRPHYWVLAQKSLDLPTGLPALAEAVCCSDYAVLTDDALQGVTPGELYDLLSLAMATIGHAHTPADNDAVNKTVTALACTPAAIQLKESVVQLLRLAVDTVSKQARVATDYYALEAFSALSALHIVHEFSADDACQLVNLAIAQRLPALYLSILLPARPAHPHTDLATQLTADMVVELLQLTLQDAAAGWWSKLVVFQGLCTGDHALSTSQCMSIIHTAAEVLVPDDLKLDAWCLAQSLRVINSLRSLQMASSAGIYSELQHVLSISTQRQIPDEVAAESTSLLCRLPCAKDIAISDLEELASRAEDLWGKEAKAGAPIIRLHTRKVLVRLGGTTMVGGIEYSSI